MLAGSICEAETFFTESLKIDPSYVPALMGLGKLISQKVFLKSFCKCQFPHEFVNVFFILVIEKNKLTDVWGG